MNHLQMLAELAQGWDVKLTSHELGPSLATWELKISGPRSWHLYRGTLENVIARAWAGEPGEDGSHVSASERNSGDWG